MKVKSNPVCAAHRLVFCAVILTLIFSVGCTSIKLIADYDEIIDSSITEFQKNMETHLIKLERNIGTDDASHENNIDFYDEARVELSSIRVRAAAIPKNELTLTQIELLIQNLENLEKIHKLGMAANDIPPLRNAFNTGTTAILKLELAKKRGIEIEE